MGRVRGWREDHKLAGVSLLTCTCIVGTLRHALQNASDACCSSSVEVYQRLSPSSHVCFKATTKASRHRLFPDKGGWDSQETERVHQGYVRVVPHGKNSPVNVDNVARYRQPFYENPAPVGAKQGTCTKGSVRERDTNTHAVACAHASESLGAHQIRANY